MPKRKAEVNGREKSPRLPPPPPSHDEDDSDFCEIIEAPPKAAALVPSSIPPQRSAVASPLTPAPLSDIFYQNLNSHRDHASMSSFAGLTQEMPFVQPATAQGFGFPPMQNSLGNFFQANPFGFSPGVLGRPAGVQDGRYFVEHALPRPLTSSSGGGSSGVPVQARVRVRENTPAEEIKEEPDTLYPTQEELSSVEILRSHGLDVDEAVRFLRQNGHNLQAAIQQAMETVTNRSDWHLEDRVRLESEKEKDRVAAQRRQDDMSLTVVGDIVPRFRESLLLDEKEGCAPFRRAVRQVSKGKEGWAPALSAFREKAVKLLFLEQKSVRWYRQNISQVRGYFRQVITRLEDFVQNRNTQTRGDGEAAEGKSGVEMPVFTGKANGNGANSDHDNEADTIKGSEFLTSCLHSEIEALEKILFMLPSTAGGVPDAFLKCNDHTATLETDGIEEICHESADVSRSRRSSKRLVIALDDD